jgi:hypothetical protein
MAEKTEAQTQKAERIETGKSEIAETETGKTKPEKTELTKKEKLFQSSKKVIYFINRTHGTSYRLLERLAGGFQCGAYLIENAEGEKAVLKWNYRKSTVEKLEQTAQAIKHARAFGWPTPDWTAWGITPSGYPYQIQEFVAGSSPERVTTALVKEILRVIDLQAGKAPDTDQDWMKYDLGVVYEGEDDFFKKIADYSESGKELVELISGKLERFRNVDIPNGDLVHGDMHSGNILMVGDKVAGIIDTEYLGKGSRFHDVCHLIVFILLFDGEEGAMEQLLTYARKHASPGEFEVCFATSLAAFLGVWVHRPRENAEERFAKAKEFVQSVM